MADELDPDSMAEMILRRAEIQAMFHESRSEEQRELMEEIQSLRGEIRHLKTLALLPSNGIMRMFIRDLETNPRAQYTVHRWGMWYWVINFPAVTALFFLSPGVWLKWGLYITLVYSIYANFATDYGAMSAAMAADKQRPLPPIPAERSGDAAN
jgi:hypothetical protein